MKKKSGKGGKGKKSIEDGSNEENDKSASPRSAKADILKSPEKTKKGSRKLQARVTSLRKLRKRKSRDDHIAVAFVEEDSVVVMETEDMEVTFPSQDNTSEGESSKSVEAGPSGELVNNNATALGKQKIRKHKIKQIPDEDMDRENELQ